MDLAKLGYQQVLEEGVGVVPTLRTTSVANKQSRERLTEGWALRPAKKAYRFSEKQKAYLTAKFNIGQSTGRESRRKSCSMRYETCPWFEWRAAF